MTLSDNLSLHAVMGGVFFMIFCMLIGDTAMLFQEYREERRERQYTDEIELNLTTSVPRLMITRV